MKSILKDRKGQNLVEFALVVPMLLLLVFGIAEYGRAWMTKNIMTGAAREAVRMAAVPPPSGSNQASWDAAIRNRATAILRSAGLANITDSNVTVNDTGASFGTVSVIVTYEFPIAVVGFIPGLSGSTLSLSSETSMRREY